MKRAILVALGIGTVISSGAAALGIGAATVFAPQVPSRAQYVAQLAAVDTSLEQALANCEEAGKSERELCRAEASAASLVGTADAEADFRRNQDSARAAQRARIEARYYVERARCAAFSGARKDQCFVAAHAARGSALMEVAAPYDNRG